MAEPPDKRALEGLRDGLERLASHEGRGPAHAQILGFANSVSALGDRVGVTVDLGAQAVLGQPVVVLRPREGQAPEFAELTKRELEVAALVAKGLRNREIAEVLGISLGTVKDHVHRILAKSGLESRAEVAALWREI